MLLNPQVVPDTQTKLEFEMYAEKEIALQRFTGYISRGLLLTMLRRVDPRLAQRVHEPQRPKPYSVTPLRFKSKARTADGYILDLRYPCRFKFRFLEEGHAPKLINYFARRGEVLIFDTIFKVASLSVRSKDSSELEAQAKPPHAFRLVFRSPTSCRA